VTVIPTSTRFVRWLSPVLVVFQTVFYAFHVPLVVLFFLVFFVSFFFFFLVVFFFVFHVFVVVNFSHVYVLSCIDAGGKSPDKLGLGVGVIALPGRPSTRRLGTRQCGTSTASFLHSYHPRTCRQVDNEFRLSIWPVWKDRLCTEKLIKKIWPTILSYRHRFSLVKELSRRLTAATEHTRKATCRFQRMSQWL